jgi:hypothetical protein
MKKLLIFFLSTLLSFSPIASAVSTDACYDSSDTKLLMHMDNEDAPTTFSDNSGNSHTFTASGDATLNATVRKIGYKAITFDGAGDYLSIPDSNDWDFGTADYTVDFWVRFNDVGASGGRVALVDISDGYNNSGLAIHLYNDSSLIVYSLSSSYTFSWSPTTGTWYHVALVRSGTSLKAYVNGNQIGSTQTDSSNITGGTAGVRVGSLAGIAWYLNGYIDELRISKGILRWEDNFTPQTTEYTSDVNTVLLLHGEGLSASTTITDSSNSAHTVTANGDAKLNPGGGYFGSSSALFDGNGDYITTADSADWYFGNGDFTIDAWVRFNEIGTAPTVKYSTILGQVDVSATNYVSWWLTLHFDGTSTYTIDFFYSTDGINLASHLASGSVSVTSGTWYHVAVVRNGSNIMLFWNGNQIGTTYNAGTDTLYNTSAPLTIGSIEPSQPLVNQYPLNGSLDEIRIIKGTAIWTSNFSVPTTSYSECANRKRFFMIS